MGENWGDYRDLKAYRGACEMVLQIFKLTTNYPKNETYGLVEQMKRAAVSIPLNVAEGHGRGTRKEFLRFLKIAFGSCNELESQLTLSRKLEFITESEYSRARSKQRYVSHLLSKLISSLES